MATDILVKEHKWKTDLGQLSDPNSFNDKIDISGLSTKCLIEALHSMVRIRLAEQEIANLTTTGLVKCPIHLAIGQEAIPVGIAANLRKTDHAFGNHRSHGHYLAMGGDPRKLFAEIMGKFTGCSHGFGGSMHIYAKEVGFYGSVPIVAGTISLAVGASIAAKFDNNGDVAVAFFGDGACEEGVFHECLNISASMGLPMIFVVENNLFSSHLDVYFRQPSDRMARFAESAKIEHCTIDGNNVVEVITKSGALIEKMRLNSTPILIEAITYRWLGHAGPRDDIDVGVRRSHDEVLAWRKRDPIARALNALIDEEKYTLAEFNNYSEKIYREFKNMCADVTNDPFPPENTLMDFVYAK